MTKNLILPQLKSFKGRETLNVFTAFSTKLSDILMLNETHFASIRESTSVVFIWRQSISCIINLGKNPKCLAVTHFWAHALSSALFIERTLYRVHALLSAHFFSARFIECTLYWAHALLTVRFLSARFIERTLY